MTSAVHATAPRVRTTPSNRSMGVRSCARSLLLMKAPLTTSATSHAWATTRSAVTVPRQTDVTR